MKKLMVIINPSSGRERAAETIKTFKKRFGNDFDEINIMETKGYKDASNFAKEAAKESYHSIASVGGDGTLNEVITGLKDEENIPNVMVIPAGTTNLVARGLKMSMNVDEAIKNIDLENTKKMDIGVVNNEQSFGFMLSIGAVPDAMHEVTKDEKTKLGALAYATTSAEKLMQNIKYDLEIEFDENQKFSGILEHVVVALSGEMAFLKFSDVNAAYDDGYFHVYLFKENNILEKIGLAGMALVGKLQEHPDIIYYKTKKLKIRENTSIEVFSDIDGEKGPALPLEIEVMPRKIPVYLPKENKFSILKK